MKNQAYFQSKQTRILDKFMHNLQSILVNYFEYFQFNSQNMEIMAF